MAGSTSESNGVEPSVAVPADRPGHQRRHVDLLRVSSALCRAAAGEPLSLQR